MKRKNNYTINVPEGDDYCPSDALMNDFRKNIDKFIDYPKNIEFSSTSVDFFKKMANEVMENEDNIQFNWYDIPESDLPPLTVNLRKANGKYFLQYLKEYGEFYGRENTVIDCKQRKGKNKFGKIEVKKYVEGDKPTRGGR